MEDLKKLIEILNILKETIGLVLKNPEYFEIYCGKELVVLANSIWRDELANKIEKAITQIKEENSNSQLLEKLHEVGLTGKQLELKHEVVITLWDLIKKSEKFIIELIKRLLKCLNIIIDSILKVASFGMLEPVKEFKDMLEVMLK